MVTRDIKEIKEKKLKFNIIDLIIVLFIVLAAVGIFMRYNLADKINFNAYGETFEIEFLIGDIQEASQEYLKAGETFYINVESLEIGTIKDILDIRNPAPVDVQDWKGNITKSELPGRIEVVGVMTSKGRTTKDGDVMINGNTFVAPNKEFLAHTDKWEGLVRVLSVTKVS